MGYVHDTAMSKFIAPGECIKTIGTWADTVGNVANTYMSRKAAAGNSPIVAIPINIPQNAVAQKGCLLKSVDIWWENATADLTSLTATIKKATLPTDTNAIAAPASLAFSYDSLNDTAGKRIVQDQRKMTLTLTTPVWLGADDYVYVELAIVAAAGSVFDFYGARANFTLRV